MTDPLKHDPAGDQTVVADRIRALRQARGWSQEDVALKMRAEGFAWLQSTLTKTESAARPIRLTEAEALARIFEVGLKDLVEPEIDPFAARMQKEAALLHTAEQRLAKAKQNLDAWNWQAWAATHRFNAVQRMGDYIDEPDGEGFDESVVMLYRYTKGDEWIEVLQEIGIDKARIDAKREYIARHAFGDDDDRTLARGLNRYPTLSDPPGSRVDQAVSDASSADLKRQREAAEKESLDRRELRRAEIDRRRHLSGRARLAYLEEQDKAAFEREGQ